MGFLRVLLAVAVVIAHSQSLFGLKLTGGLVAVEIFFIISGFYMSMILEQKYVGKGSYFLFLSNRFLRLYPIFFTILVLTILTSIFSYLFRDDWYRLSPFIQHYEHLRLETIFFQLFANIAIFGQDIAMFLGVNTETGAMYFTHNYQVSKLQFSSFMLIPQAWTLGVELIYYLIAPFIIRKSNWFIVLLIMVSILIRLYIHYFLGYTNDPWTYRFFPSEIALFLMGTISYRLYSNYKVQKLTLFKVQLSYIVVAILFLMLICYEFIEKVMGVNAFNWLIYAFCCFTIPFLFELSKNSKLDTRIGELSYPIYISHILVIACISPFISFLKIHQFKGEIIIICTIAISCILVKFISDPIERIRQSRANINNSKNT